MIGRLTKDPNVTHAKTRENEDMTVARFTLAVDRRFKRDGEQSADFITCVAFGKQAEFIEKYLVKGTKIAVTGRIQTGSYKNKDGNTVYTTDVNVEECEFAESKAAAENYQQKNNTEQPKQETPKQEEQKADENGFMNIPDGLDDDELPFN